MTLFDEPKDFSAHQLGFGFYFDDPAAFFFRMARYKFIWRHLRPTDRVLELACGDGMGSYFLATGASKVVGVDLEPEFIDHATRTFVRENLRFECGNALTHRDEEPHDVVLALNLLDILAPEEKERLHETVTRALSPAGCAYYAGVNAAFRHLGTDRRKEMHKEEQTAQQYRHMLEAWFERVDIYSMNDEFVLPSYSETCWSYVIRCMQPKKP